MPLGQVCADFPIFRADQARFDRRGGREPKPAHAENFSRRPGGDGGLTLRSWLGDLDSNQD